MRSSFLQIACVAKRMGGFFVILMLCVGNTGTASPQGESRADGNWWRQLKPINKMTAIIGFCEGMNLGHAFTLFDLQPGAIKSASASYGQYHALYVQPVRYGQMLDGLDAFYEDYRNRRIRVNHALWVVLNEITGTPEETTRKMTEAYRRSQ